MIKSILILIPFLIIAVFAAYSNDIDHIQVAQKDLPYAENFSLDSLNDDGKIELDDFKGKPIVINLWASWCGPCKEEMPLFEKMWNKHKATGVIFIGVDVMDDKKSAAEFIKKMRVTYSNVYDPSGEVLHKYGVSGLPATVFVDRDGKIALKSYGPFLGDEGEKRFESYLKGIAE